MEGTSVDGTEDVLYSLTTLHFVFCFSGVLTNLERVSIDAIRNKVFLYVLVFLVCWSPGKIFLTF